MRDHTWIAESSREAMGRVAGTLFLIGVVLTISGVLLPHSSEADVGGFWLLEPATRRFGVLSRVSELRQTLERAHPDLVVSLRTAPEGRASWAPAFAVLKVNAQ